MGPHRHVIDRPVPCQSCNGQGHSGDITPKVIIDTSSLDKVGYLSGSVKCGWCGIEISAPTVDEAIHKWGRIQEIIRLGYTVLNPGKESSPPGAQFQIHNDKDLDKMRNDWIDSFKEAEGPHEPEIPK